jgi:hypothetical protein
MSSVLSPGLLGLLALATPDPKNVVVMARSEGNVDSVVLLQVEQAAMAAAREVLKDQLLAPTEPRNAELDAARAKARDLMKASQEAANNLETDKSLELAEQSLAQWQLAAVSTGDIREMAEVHVLLFKACLWNERPQNAQEHVRMAVALQPALVRLDGDASEDEQALWKKVASDVLRQPRGVLTLVSNPPGAHAFVDGVDKGASPVTVREMVPGRHVVRFSMPWRGPVLLSAVVPPGGEGRAQASLLENDAFARVRSQMASDGLTGNATEWRNGLKPLRAETALILAVHQPDAASAFVDITAHVFQVSDGSRKRRMQAHVDLIRLDQEVKNLVTSALDLSKGPGVPGGARFKDAPPEARGAVAPEDAGKPSGGGGPPAVVAVVPWVLLVAAVPLVAVVALAGGFAAGALVTGLYFQDQLARQDAANRRAVRRGRAAQTTTQGY